MSYPHPKYFGTTGESSALFRPAGQRPELSYNAGGSVSYLATTDVTGGEFGLYRWDFGTGVSGPDPHFHRTISETFFVLAGTVRLYDGETWRDATAGDFLYVPEGGIHGFKNESGEKASMLLLFTPGAPREAYFETLGAFGRGLTMTAAEKDAFYAAHDNIWQ
jgi:quercetin dioxygenase-like cupin family protein